MRFEIVDPRALAEETARKTKHSFFRRIQSVPDEIYEDCVNAFNVFVRTNTLSMKGSHLDQSALLRWLPFMSPAGSQLDRQVLPHAAFSYGWVLN